MTRLGVEMLPKTLPGAWISSRLRAVMSPVTLPCTTTEVPVICALTTALSPMVSASCAVISPSTWPSMRTVPSKVSLPLTRLPLPRNALVPPVSSTWVVLSRSNISPSRGAGSRGGTGAAPGPNPRGRSLRSRSLPNSAIAALRCRGPCPAAAVVGFPKKRPASSTGSPTVSKQSGARQGLAEAVDQAVELGVGVELDLDRAAPRVTRDPHARAETPRELLGEPTQVEVAGGTARGRVFPLTVPPRGRQAFRVALAQPARHDLAREAHLLRHPLDREHRARVARRQLPALELRLDRVREAEQPQRVRDRRPALPHPLGQLVLREPALVDQVAVRLGFLQRGQVLALDVLDQRELEAVLGPRLAHDHRDPLEPGAQRGAQPPLARDQLVAPRDAARDQRLEESVAADRVGQEPERLVVEVAARLLGVGHALVARHRELARRRVGAPPVLRRGKKRVDTLPQRLPHPGLHSAFLSKAHRHHHASASCGMGSASAGAASSRASARYATAPRETGS